MIHFTCPECGAEMESPDQLEGGTDFCPKCRSAVEVPPAWLDESLEENDEDQAGESEDHEFGEREEEREVKDPIAAPEEVARARNATVPAPEGRRSKWYEPLLGGLGCLLSIVLSIACILLLYLAAWLTPKILPWLVLASWLALAVSVFVLLPLSLIRATRAAGAVGMYIASYVFGVTLWFSGFFLAYAIWGMWAVLIGLVLLGVGVVPVAMLATLLNGMWGNLFGLVILLALVWGTRIFSAWVEYKGIDNPEPELSENATPKQNIEQNPPTNEDDPDTENYLHWRCDKCGAEISTPKYELGYVEVCPDCGARNTLAGGRIDGVSQVRPNVRFWARCIDMVFFALLLVLVCATFNLEVTSGALLGFLMLLAWVPIEAGFLAAFGATPGKWLLRTHVRRAVWPPMSYGEALSRSFRVWAKGIGCGIPIVTLFTHLAAFSRLKREGITSWDQRLGLVVVHSKIGFFRGLLAAVILLGVSIGSSVLEKRGRELEISELKRALNIAERPEGDSRDVGIPTDWELPPTVPPPTGHPSDRAVGRAPARSVEEDKRRHQQRHPGRTARGPRKSNQNQRIGTAATGKQTAAYYYNLGNGYSDLNQYTDAIAAYKKAIAIKPDFANAYFNMGIAYQFLNQGDKAIAAYKKAIAIKPDYANAYLNMGDIYRSLGQHDDAIAAYRQYLRLEPKGPWADDAREAIRKVQGK